MICSRDIQNGWMLFRMRARVQFSNLFFRKATFPDTSCFGKHQHRKNKLRNHVIQGTSCTYTANFKLDSPVDKISRRENLFYDFHTHPFRSLRSFLRSSLKKKKIYKYLYIPSRPIFILLLIKCYERVNKDKSKFNF